MEVYNTTFVDADFAHGTALAFMLTVVTAVFALLYVFGFRRATR